MVNQIKLYFAISLFTICHLILNHSASAGISPVLREVNVPCITNAECAATYGATITDGNICVDTTGGMGSCNVSFILSHSKIHSK